MLAYIFWHRPASGAEPDRYERALERFHRSLAHRPPAGFRGSAAYRLAELPWPAGRGEAGAGEPHAGGGPGYEDWYLVEDWAALGVLEEAAVSRGHASAHDAAAAHIGAGTAAVYRLLEGSARLDGAGEATWVTAAPQREPAGPGELLGDGLDPARDSLWRRCLVLGPAPEYCLLAAEPPPGVAPSRLPQGWRATAVARDALWSRLTQDG